MNADTTYPHEEELKALVHAARDGAITAAQGARLDELLIADAAARQIYCQLAMLAADLEMELARHPWSAVESPPAPGGNAKPAPVVRRSIRQLPVVTLIKELVQQPVMLAVLVVSLVSGAILAYHLSRQPAPVAHAEKKSFSPGKADFPAASSEGIENGKHQEGPLTPDALAAAPVVARLSRTVAAVWSETDSADPPGNTGPRARAAPLHAGERMVLSKGLAEIAFESGATVILEGPANLVLGSGESQSDIRNSCQLALGKLVARVPKQAHGFAVRTPTMNIVDLGTEFGIEVKSVDGAYIGRPKSVRSTVQVFQGEVAIRPAMDVLAQASTEKPPTILRAGEGAATDGAGQPPHKIKADGTVFVREISEKTTTDTSKIIVDNFSAGKDFSVSTPQVVTLVGDGPLGGHRQIRVSTVGGANTTSLTVGAGTLSIQTTGFADTNVDWGALDSNHPSKLNLAVPGTASMKLELTALDVGLYRGGGIYLRVQDGKGQSLEYVVTEKELTGLKAKNGGVLSVPLSRFRNFNLFNGIVDGVNVSFDDCDMQGTIKEVSFANSAKATHSALGVPGAAPK